MPTAPAPIRSPASPQAPHRPGADGSEHGRAALDQGRLSSSLLAIRDLLTSQWRVPEGVSPSLTHEWRLIGVRWVGVLLIAPALPLAQLPPDRLAAAYGILAAAAALNTLYWYVLKVRPAVLANGYLTTLGDVLLHIAMIIVGGGFSSPFYFITFTIATSTAMRYGYGPAIGVVAVIVGLDSAEHVITGTPPDAWFAFRSAFLTLTTILAAYLRDLALRAENALQDRLHDANLLNEATAELGASLELEPLLRAVARAGAHLLRSEHMVVRLIGEPGDDSFGGEPAAATYPGMANSIVTRALEILCERREDEHKLLIPQRHSVSFDTLSTGQRACIIQLWLPTQRPTWVTLACVVSAAQFNRHLDDDILDSFAERVALALENASLYRALSVRSDALFNAYADLATAHQELMRLDQMKNDFLANVSHELRTPLSSIRSFSELLLAYDDDPVARTEFVQIINSESERLARLVGDVLDVMKIESDNMDWNMASLDVQTVLQGMQRTYAPLIAMHGIAFSMHLDGEIPPVTADRDRIEQVLSNLLNNAIKFTESGSITLSATRVGDQAEISVCDTGIGIAPGDAERIFERFMQVGPMLTGKPRGSGLGLTICREIIQHHGGQIWVESHPGEGSIFKVTLPLATELAPTKA